MSRIYSNYDSTDYADILALAESMGFTVSSFQKYCVMLYLNKNLSHRKSSLSLPQLNADMMTALQKMPNDSQPFIVSSLFSSEVWSNLSSSDKHTLAIQLSKYIKNNPSEFMVCSRVKGEPNKYKKL